MITIEYGVVAKGAKEGFVPELLNCSEISKADDLTKDDLIFKNFGNPCEDYSVLLDGSSLPIPENMEDENIGVWSLYAVNEKGEFEDVLPTITFTADELFSVDGFGLTFDTYRNIYPTEFTISWYNGGNLIATEQCESSSPIFLFSKDISNFNKISIVFEKMNTPYSRLKLHSVQYGSSSIIDGKSIKNIKVNQQISPISTTMPISSLDLTFLNSNNANYNFAARQSLKVLDDNVLIGKFFIENARQTSRQQWSIQGQDYIALLEDVDFEGGIYDKSSAFSILTDIFNKANVPFTIAENLKSLTVTGYIPYTTCRNALQQVLFAIAAYAKTAYSESVDILEGNLSPVESIGLDRILTGQTVTVDADITDIELVGHTYTPITDEIVLHKASEAEDSVKVIFSEPVHDLSIDNGEILASGVNYAIISCEADATLKGQKYEHLTFSKSKQNLTNAKNANKKTIKNATLISASNIDKILNVCYNYIIRNSTIKSRIIESGTPLVVGNAYEIETELLGKVTGVLNEQSFALYGGKKIVKEAVIK